MSDNFDESSEIENDENQRGVILGFWDHEKTSSLIEDLEYSVNSVEKKCKKLLEELIYYKKFLEESDNRQSNRLNVKGQKNSQNSWSLSGSDPDISFRKKLVSELQLTQVFEQKFKEKLNKINWELMEAADKIGLKNNIVLFPTEDYLKTIHSETRQQIDKTWSDICHEFLKMNYFRTKSDTMVENANSEDYAQITKEELRLYQKLSRMSVKKRKGRKEKQAKRVKFACSKKSSCKPEEASWKMAKASKRRRRRKRRKYTSNEENKDASNIQLMCRSLTETMEKTEKTKGVKPKEEEEEQEGRVSLGSVIRKAMPFTTCKSTSRSYNIGVNVQQFLSQTKYEKAKNLKKRKESGGGGEKEQKGWSSPSTFPNENNVWISEHHSSSKIRKVRSKYTGSAPEGYMEYHKSTTRQYTDGQKSMIKSESKTAYAIGTKIIVSDCRRTDYYQVDDDSQYYASGDGRCNESCNKLTMDWSKVYEAFLDIYKKYTELKKKIVGNACGLTDTEIEVLEKEIELAMNKYRDFLEFYSKFLELKHRLKSLKIACEAKMFGPVTSSSPNFERKVGPARSTYSMTMKTALRKIQDLQEKIRLIRDY